jgi:hypothetical protein
VFKSAGEHAVFKYLASVEVDQRQRVISQADKLREIIGGSRLIQETQKRVTRIVAKHSGLVLAWNVSGIQWVLAPDLDALSSCLWKIRQALVNDLHLPVTIAVVPFQGTFNATVKNLEDRIRKLKDAKAGADGSPSAPFFAQCQILPHQAANHWYPSVWRDPQRRRRALLSEEACQREQVTRQTFADQFKGFAKFQTFSGGPPIGTLPLEFQDLVLSEADSYIAFVKADADGMGRLLMRLDWDALAKRLQTQPWQASLEFCTAVDRCLKGAVREAVDRVTASWDPGSRRRFPVAPMVLAGEDVWILCRRDLAFDLAVTMMDKYSELASKSNTLQTALEVTGLLGQEKLTLSCGVLFAKQGFPFEVQLDMAEELVHLAKERRRSFSAGDLQGCLDFHWLESSAREKVREMRSAALTYQDNGKLFRLYTRPWTAEETRRYLEAAKELITLPRRKLLQLERIVRYGDELSEVAFAQWKGTLGPAEREKLDKAVKSVRGHNLWCPVPGTSNEYKTALMELIELCEIQRPPE